MPDRVGDGIGRVVDQPKVGATLKEIGIVEAQQGNSGLFGVAHGLPGQRGQLVFGLPWPALGVGGLGGHEAGFETATLLDGRAGQPFGQGVVVVGAGADRTGQQKFRAAATADETQRRQPRSPFR
jgi:hypothetical protein